MAIKYSVLLGIIAGCVCLCCMSAGAAAQESVKDGLLNSLLPEAPKRYITFTNENDLYGSGEDQNYTNGTRIGWFEAGKKPPGVTRQLEKILPFLTINEATSVSYSIGQNLYTPDDVESTAQDPRDRPWAGFLYGSMGMVTVTDSYADEYELTLGVVGPMAQGKPVQRFIHRLVDTTTPRGWHNQLKNEPGLVASWQRRWPQVWKAQFDGLFFGFSPHAGATAGNIHTYANAGGTFKIAPESGRWSDQPLRVRPAMPGTGYFPASDGMGWEMFFGLDGRAVARNIFLDGNTFASSHSVDKYPLVADLSAGVALTIGPARISYTLVYRTKEFTAQDNGDVFGGISVGYNF